MRIYPLAIATLLVLASCSKDPVKLEKENYLIFGTYNGFCMGNCTSLFRISETELYADDMSTFIPGEELKFEEVPLSAEKYQLATDMFNDFPQELTDSQDASYGCPGCLDQDIIYLKFFDGADTYEWTVDTDPEALPEFLKNYASDIVTLVDTLMK